MGACPCPSFRFSNSLDRCADCRVRRYDLRNGQMLTDYVGSPVASVCFTADGQCILVGGAAASDAAKETVSAKLFDKTTGELLQEYSGHLNRRYRVEAVLDCSDRVVLSGSEDGRVRCWDLVEGSVLAALDHNGRVKEEEGGDQAGSMLQQLTANNTSLTVHSLSFHPERCELLTAAKGTVYVWRGKSEAEEDMEQEDS